MDAHADRQALSILLDLCERLEIVDLSHTLEEQMPVWPTLSKYYHTLWLSLEFGDNATAYQLLLNEHTGTHVDATAHFLPPGHPAHMWIDEVPLEHLQGRAAVIDCRSLSPRHQAEGAVIQQWEKQHGPILAGDVVLFNFGWWKRWKPRPRDTEFLRDWPGLTEEAVQVLIARRVKAVGVDTPSPDAYGTVSDPVHKRLLGQGIAIIENLTNLDLLPPRCFFLGLPLKIKNGTGSPIRAVALVPKEAHDSRQE